PYLAWAEADGFVGYQVPGRPPELPHWLPLVIALREGADVMALVDACDTAWLRVPQAYGLVPGLRHCSARVTRAFFRHWRTRPGLRALIERFELGLPVEQLPLSLSGCCQPRTAAPAPQPARGRVGGCVLGVIDGGLAIANTAFLDGRGH